MDILPSIDLLDGKVVRLARGDYDERTVYSEDPLAIAGQFIDAGARWIHVVDLDAARSGRLSNTDALRGICRLAATRDVEVQSGGGVRNMEAIATLRAAGVRRMVVGSAAMKDWEWFERLLEGDDPPNDMLALGLDARGGFVAAEGWTEQLAQTAREIASRVRGSGLGAIVHTDIARDGMLAGVNLEATEEIISATDVPIIASGGVRSIEDVRGCLELGCSGVIIGKAYYEGRIDLARAVAEAG